MTEPKVENIDIINVVKEFLSHYNYNDTLLSFKTELLKSGKKDLKNINSKELKQKLFVYLEKGKKKDFLNLFSKMFIKNDDTTLITFKVNTYFTLLPLYTSNYSKYLKRVKEFKSYCETSSENTKLTENEEMLKFFLLPFIKNPKTHPSFSKLFDDNESKVKMENEIKLFITSKIDKNELRVNLSKPVVLEQLVKSHQNFLMLFKLSETMLAALDGVLKGKKLNKKFYTVVSKKMKKIKPHEKINLQNDSKLYPHLNYSKLIKYLYSLQFKTSGEEQEVDEDEKKVVLLQALRWRIQKTFPVKRKEILFNFITNDIVKDDKLDSIFMSKNDKFIEYYLRLLNSILNDNNGIIYLSKKQKLVQNLIILLEKKKLCKQVFVVCQKLSIKVKIRKRMLELNIIKIIFENLRVNSTKNYSDDEMEYIFALLMNLILTKDSIGYCEKEADFLFILCSLIECKNLNVRTYINGCLFTSLKYSEKLKKEAEMIELKKKLVDLKKRSNSEYATQLDFVLEIMDKPVEKKNVDLVDEDEDEEESFWDNQCFGNEEMIEEKESIETGEIDGEKVLKKYYSTNKRAKAARINYLRQSRIDIKSKSSKIKNSIRNRGNLPEVSFSFEKMKLQSMLKKIKTENGEIDTTKKIEPKREEKIEVVEKVDKKEEDPLFGFKAEMGDIDKKKEDPIFGFEKKDKKEGEKEVEEKEEIKFEEDFDSDSDSDEKKDSSSDSSDDESSSDSSSEDDSSSDSDE